MPEMQTLFWCSIALLFYTYVGYPAILWAWARLRPQLHQAGRAESEVSILVVAHNEAAVIESRLKNLLSLDYPRDRIEIVVASDGSTDDTAARARKFCEMGVRVVEFTAHRGKPAALNTLVPMARTGIVVFADARQRFHPGALRALTGHFIDPAVGAVSGELILTQDQGGSAVGEGVGFYWHYEKFIRRHEALVDSTVGATGAFYAIRRRLFEPIPEDTILDDVLIPMTVVGKGYRVLFAADARAYDTVSTTAGAEYARKVRTIAGNFQLLFRQRWLLKPLSNRLWFQTVSHKLCRLLCPACLIAAFVMNLLMLQLPVYRLLLAAQILFYTAALGGYLIRNTSWRSTVLNVPYAFCLLNWATVMGFAWFVAGRQQVTWQKAAG